MVLFIGNHGEDVKECYYYLDSTPTHSYMKALYKYPQNEYPYGWLVNENRNRSRQEPEFELPDTGEIRHSTQHPDCVIFLGSLLTPGFNCPHWLQNWVG